MRSACRPEPVIFVGRVCGVSEDPVPDDPWKRIARSDGHQVATGEPFLEARTDAVDQGELVEEVWAALAPEFCVAAAVFKPGHLAEARHPPRGGYTV